VVSTKLMSHLVANNTPYFLSRILGADITDYFNYGFCEETWKLYCERQRQMKSEVGHLNKTVSKSTSSLARHHSIAISTHTNRKLVHANYAINCCYCTNNSYSIIIVCFVISIMCINIDIINNDFSEQQQLPLYEVGHYLGLAFPMESPLRSRSCLIRVSSTQDLTQLYDSH